MSIRVAVIWANYGPYHVARARALQQIEDIEPTFVELSPKVPHREWEADKDSISDHLVTLLDDQCERYSTTEIRQRLVQKLQQISPDAVVASGYDTRPMRGAARWATKSGRASILTFVTTKLDHRRWWWKELVKKWFVRRYFHAGLAAGTRQRQYLAGLGMPHKYIWEAGNVIDKDYFATAAIHASLNEVQHRERLCLPERYFLYVGRFVPEKNLMRLLMAYKRFRIAWPAGWGLVLVGDGPQREQLERFALGQGLDEVQWPGFKQLDELPSYYALSSALILPSTSEPWGLVVNEAMACGLPVLVSDRCGCAPDLVEEGVNGSTFNPYKVSEMADRMGNMVSLSETERATMGRQSGKLIADYTPEVWANILADCIRQTVARVSRNRP